MIAYLETVDGDRVVRIRPEEDGMVAYATIEDGDSRQLFGLTVSYDENATTMAFSEYTDTDTLTLAQTLSPNDVMEAYTFNGEHLTVHYPPVSQPAMTEAIEDYNAHRFDEIDTKLLDAFYAFDAFYRTDNSLHENEEGKRLVETVYDLAQSEGVGTYYCRSCIDAFCGFVAIGTALKCEFGAILNVGCIVGTPIALACAIFEVVCSFGCHD